MKSKDEKRQKIFLISWWTINSNTKKWFSYFLQDERETKKHTPFKWKKCVQYINWVLRRSKAMVFLPRIALPPIPKHVFILYQNVMA